MQLRIEYSEITNKIYTAFYQQFNHFSQLPIAHLVLTLSVRNINHLQQHTSEICCKMINCLNINELLLQIIPCR